MEDVLAAPPVVATPIALVRTGRVLTGLTVALLLLDAVGKLIPLAPVVEGTQKVGFAVTVIRPLGVVLVVSALLHLMPRTQFLGAVLLTAYFGGAVATNVRMGTPFWMPVLMGVILWISYSLRSSRLRAFLLSTSR